MKIGDVARQLNTTVRTLRFYEESGLIHPARSPGGTRQYDQKSLERFRSIIQLSSLGVPLRKLEQLSRVRLECRTGEEASHRVAGLLADMRVELEQQRKRIALMQEQLRGAQALVERCQGCKHKPTQEDCPNCPVIENCDSAQVLHLILDELNANAH